MNVYDENWNLLESDPDLNKGRIEQRTKVVRIIPASPEVQEQGHDELMEGTEDLYRYVVDVPYSPAVEEHEETEDVYVYVPYTQEELEEMSKPTDSDRLDAVEAAVMELMLRGASNV